MIHLDVELIRLAAIVVGGLNDLQARRVSQIPTKTESHRIAAIADRVIFHAAYRAGRYDVFANLPTSKRMPSLPGDALVGAAVNLAYVLGHELSHIRDFKYPEDALEDRSDLMGEGLLQMMRHMRPLALCDLPDAEVLYKKYGEESAHFSSELRGDIAGTISAFHIGSRILQISLSDTLTYISGISTIQALLEVAEAMIAGNDKLPTEIATREMVALGVAFNSAIRPEGASARDALSRQAVDVLNRRRQLFHEIMISVCARLAAPPRGRRDRQPGNGRCQTNGLVG